MTLLSPNTTYVPRGANPGYVLTMLNNLVTEFKAAGYESITIDDLEHAIKAISR